MIKIKEAILVEGKYDVNTLRQIVDTVVLETGGFRIFNDKERLQMIRRIAAKRGILILTDSDGAGFVIRNFLKGALPTSQVKHAYIPDIIGKESRKAHASKEGKLGVEGMRPEVLREVLRRAGATLLDDRVDAETSLGITKADFYALGLSGGPHSAKRRQLLLQELALPAHMSANALIDFLNAVSDAEEIQKILSKIPEEDS